MKKLHTLMWRAMFLILVIVILYAALREDRDGLTAFNRAQDAMTKDDWVGWIHPLGPEITRTLEVGPFDSRVECEDYAWTYIQKKYEGWDKAAFYCGYACSDTDAKLREANCKMVK